MPSYNEMPESLREFLTSLDDDLANELWLWFDGNRYADTDCIDAIVDTHPKEKKQMKVNKSKSPTLKQLLNMAANLKEKFNKPACVEIKAWQFDSNRSNANRATFNIYAADLCSIYLESWSECQDKYFELMGKEQEEAPCQSGSAGKE